MNQFKRGLRITILTIGLFFLSSSVMNFVWWSAVFQNHWNVYTADGDVNLRSEWILLFGSAILSLAIATRLERQLRVWSSILCLILSVLVGFAFGEIGHTRFRQVTASNDRLEILEKRYGPRIDMCKILKTGMTESEVTRLMAASDKLSSRFDFQFQAKSFYHFMYAPPIPTGATYRDVTFSAETGRVVEIECFDGTRIKSPGSVPMTIREYRE